MALPTEVAVRTVVGTEMYTDGSLVNGQITFTAQPEELVARTSKTTIVMLPIAVMVVNGTFSVNLICYDGATTDAGTGGAPWAYAVSRTWDEGTVYVTVRKGPLGTTADPALDFSDLMSLTAPPNLALVAGIKGDTGPAGSVTSVASIAPDYAGNVALTPGNIGAASLVGGQVPTSQLPAIALTTVVVVASQAAMLALTTAQVQPGDVATRTDGAGTFMLNAADPSVLANWVLLNAPTDKVVSVNGQVGTVVLAQADVGLGNVNNTSDANKPVSTAATAAFVSNSLLTTIGDLVVATGPGTPSRLPVGATGTVLTADSTQPSGVRWSVGPGGALTWYPITLLAGTASTGYRAPRYCKDPLGFVHVEGVVDGYGATGSLKIFNLPAGYQPAVPIEVSISVDVGYGASGTVGANGDVYLNPSSQGSTPAGSRVGLQFTFYAG